MTAALLFCRNGEQIDFIFVEENFNFEMQQTVHLGNVRNIKQVDPTRVHSCILAHICPAVMWFYSSKRLKCGKFVTFS